MYILFKTKTLQSTGEGKDDVDFDPSWVLDEFAVRKSANACTYYYANL